MKRNNKLYLLVLLVLACLILLATGTYAAYTDTAYARRVVTTGIDTNLLPFSSNYLYEHPSNTYFRHTVSVPNGNTTLYLTICNYPQKDNTKFSSSDIIYTLDISVVDKDGSKVAVTPPTIEADPGREYTLLGRQTSTHVYAVTFTSQQVIDFQDYFVRITATSKNGWELAAEFKLVDAPSLDGEWKGRFTDGDTDDENVIIEPKDLDAFNYEVSGTGKGTLTVSWDDTVTLSQWCREDLDSDSTGNSISFDVGGENKPTSYLLQFYRLNGRAEGDHWPSIEVSWVKAPDPTEATTEPTP